MNGSGWFAGSAAVLWALPAPRCRRAFLASGWAVGAVAGAWVGADFFFRGGGPFGTGFGPRSAPLDVGPVRWAFLTDEPEAARARLRVDARVAIRLRGPRTGV